MPIVSRPDSQDRLPGATHVRGWRNGEVKSSADCFADRLGDMLVEVYHAIPESEFCGVGLLVCSDPSQLPHVPLTGAKHVPPCGEVLAAICRASTRTNGHDGFHFLSPDWTLTHTNQYISPPVPSDLHSVVERSDFGARHMSALLASRLPEVICAGVLNSRLKVVLFIGGRLYNEFSP